MLQRTLHFDRTCNPRGTEVSLKQTHASSTGMLTFSMLHWYWASNQSEGILTASYTMYFFVHRYWLTNNVHIKRPTTGLLMYTMATRFCEEIHLYGFWPFPLDPQGRPVKYHYYDTLKYEYTSSSSPHTMPLEFRTLSTLHRQGALRLHTGTCDRQTEAPTELQSKNQKEG